MVVPFFFFCPALCVCVCVSFSIMHSATQCARKFIMVGNSFSARTILEQKISLELITPFFVVWRSSTAGGYGLPISIKPDKSTPTITNIRVRFLGDGPGTACGGSRCAQHSTHSVPNL